MLRSHSFLRLVIAIGASQLAGILGSFFTMSAIPEWYRYLLKPAIAPPNWVFGLVWTTLFILMGVAAWLVWERGARRRDVRIALGLFLIQLGLNTLWSVVFFGLQNPGAAFVEILILIIAILATMRAFYPISRLAALLLAPYIAWVSFAAYITWSIYQLNTPLT
ncbi:MAG: TspO/MBR family protein [Candidatus Paceibacterota bacterium]|nr:MAG: TspO/MBR family protein [Candidatus Paceibacterota bacterium]